MDDSDKIQEILDEITAVVSDRTPNKRFRTEYHLAPEGCYAVLVEIENGRAKPTCLVPTVDHGFKE